MQLRNTLLSLTSILANNTDSNTKLEKLMLRKQNLELESAAFFAETESIRTTVSEYESINRIKNKIDEEAERLIKESARVKEKIDKEQNN